MPDCRRQERQSFKIQRLDHAPRKSKGPTPYMHDWESLTRDQAPYRKRCFWERPKRAWSQSCRNISSLPMSSTASIWLQFDLLGRLLRTGSKSALGFNRFCRSETGLKQVWNHVATTVHAHRADQTAVRTSKRRRQRGATLQEYRPCERRAPEIKGIPRGIGQRHDGPECMP